MQRLGHAAMATFAEAAGDVTDWDFLCLQEVPMRDDELQQMLNYDQIDEDGQRVFRNGDCPWDTAIIVSRCWAHEEWTTAMCTWAISIP